MIAIETQILNIIQELFCLFVENFTPSNASAFSLKPSQYFCTLNSGILVPKLFICNC